MSVINELLSFIRLKICIVLTLIALSGYLLFNPLSQKLYFLLPAAFFIASAGYGYNNITDAKEDKINRGKLNMFVLKRRAGFMVVAVCAFIAIAFSVFLSIGAVIATIGFLGIGLVYSGMRLKKFTILKNVVTGFSVSLLFLLGALASTPLSLNILLSYFLISLFIMSGSIISDLRDYVGDRVAGHKTIPVKFGKSVAKWVSYTLLIIFSILVLNFKLYPLFVMIPFILLVLINLRQDRYIRAHTFHILSFLGLNVWLVMK